jgi:hypothetical protein
MRSHASFWISMSFSSSSGTSRSNSCDHRIATTALRLALRTTQPCTAEALRCGPRFGARQRCQRLCEILRDCIGTVVSAAGGGLACKQRRLCSAPPALSLVEKLLAPLLPARLGLDAPEVLALVSLHADTSDLQNSKVHANGEHIECVSGIAPAGCPPS